MAMNAAPTGPPPFGPPPSGPARPGKVKVRWLRVLGGVAVIGFLALPCLLVGVVLLASSSFLARTDPVAEGRSPGRVTFDAGRERYVIALGAKPDGIFDGLTRTERRQKFLVREGDANESRCTVTHPDGTTSEIRGDRQAFSETFSNVYATIGEFDGKGGETTVECRFDPSEDMLGTPTEAPLMVHSARTGLRYLSWGLVIGSLVLGGLGTLLILWGTVWRKPRR